MAAARVAVGLAGAACPSLRFCLLVDGLGNVVSTKAPTLGASAWTPHDLRQGYNTIAGISCPSRSLCVAYDNAGNVLVSRDPASGSRSWRVFHVDAAGVSFLSCAPGPICFGLDGSGGVLTSTNPAAGASAWTLTKVGSTTSTAISCASSQLCVVAQGNGNLAIASEPTAGPGAWQIIHPDTGTAPECGKYGPGEGCDPQLDSVTCPSASFCAASDAIGNILASTNPIAAAAWTLVNVDPQGNFGYVNCPTANLCVKFDDYSNSVMVSRDPTGGPAAWATVTVTPVGVAGISCGSVARCVAYDDGGDVIASRNPGATPWNSISLDPGKNLMVNCAGGRVCIATDSQGTAFTSTNPAIGRSGWTRAPIDRLPLTSASCPTQGLCVAGDIYGRLITGT
jgi:hypothetical protein